jgi:hypothetical protein
MEQTMLFDSCLAYIINSVVVLIIADADELMFSGLSQKLSIESRLGKHKYKGFESINTFETNDNTGDNDNFGDEEDVSWRFDDSTVTSEVEVKTIHEYVDLYLTQLEKEAFEIYDYYLVRLNFFSIILPLCHGKLTGFNCSENSFIRVSEIGI